MQSRQNHHLVAAPRLDANGTLATSKISWEASSVSVRPDTPPLFHKPGTLYHHLPHQPRGLLPPSCRLTSCPPTPHIYYPQALLQPQPQSATCNTCFEMYGISCNRQPGHRHCMNRNVAKHSRRASCSSKTTRPLAQACPYWQVSGCSRAWCTCTAHANKSISQMESLSLRMTHRLADTNKIRVAFSMRWRHNIQEWVHNDSAKAKWGKKCSAHHQPCS